MRKIVLVSKFQDFIVVVIKDFSCGMGLHMAVAIGNVPLSKMPSFDGPCDKLSSARPVSHGGRGIDAFSHFDAVIYAGRTGTRGRSKR